MMIRNINPGGDVIVPSLPPGKRMVRSGGFIWIDSADEAIQFLLQRINWEPADDESLALLAKIEEYADTVAEKPWRAERRPRRSSRTNQYETQRVWPRAAEIRHPVALILRCGRQRLLMAENAWPARLTLADQRPRMKLVLGEEDCFQEEEFTGSAPSHTLGLDCSRHSHLVWGADLRAALDRLGRSGRPMNLPVADLERAEGSKPVARPGHSGNT